jgi:putative ABC transport system permease protein
VTSPTPDLSKLRINRDAPPPALRRALRRNIALGLAALALALGGVFALRRGGAMITSTTNWASFSEIAFTFRVTPGLLLGGIAFALVMGVVGGFFPARRAAKQPVVQALR